jgi:hypothetical protein
MPIHCLPTLILAACLICSPARAEYTLVEQTPPAQPAPAASPPVLAEPAPSAAAAPLSQASVPHLPVPPVLETTPQAKPAEPREPAEPGAAGEPASSFTTTIAQKFLALGVTAEQTHDLLERGILRQVIRLDDFFGKANSKQELNTSYNLRWRNSLRLEQGGSLNFGSTLRVNINLSKINERLQLAISGEDKPDTFAPSLPEDPGNPGFDRTFQNTRIVNTELRYQLIRSPVTDLFLGAGFDLALPPQAFARARYQRFQRTGEYSLIRFAETIFAKTPYGVGETTELSFERSLDPKSVLRLANSATVSQEINALEWGTELSLLHELTPRSAITLTGGVYGNTSFRNWITNYRLLARYRSNFLRNWLFYELEPQVSWPRDGFGRFTTNYACTVRLEIMFQGKQQKAAD